MIPYQFRRMVEQVVRAMWWGGNNGQIKFPVTQNASADANTLDDYEEGTWTPALIGTTGTAGTWAQTLTTCIYTKIGNLVTVNAWITLTNVGSYTGTVKITGLPFAASGYYNGTVNARGFVFAEYVTVRTEPAATILDLVNNRTNQMDVGVNYADFGANDEIMFTLTYFV